MKLGLAAALSGLAACNGGQRTEAPPPAPPAVTEDEAHPRDAVLDAMREEEADRLDVHDFAAAKPWAETSGPNPFLVHRLSADRWVGGLRGTGELVLLDAEANTIATADGRVEGLSGWTWEDNVGHAVGERSGDVHRFVVEGDAIVRKGSWHVEDAHGLRDIAVGADGVFVLADRHRSRLLSFDRKKTRTLAPCGGALQVVVAGETTLADCLLEHRIHGTTIQHDGPIWGLDAIGSKVAVAGVEDHPLDRSDGSFGYIDSFVFVYEDGKRTAEINVGMEGVVTPKWIRWKDESTIEVAGYGSAVAAEIRDGKVTPVPVVPGITSVGGSLRNGIAASPLLDAWVVLGEGEPRVVPLPDPRPSRVRVGEAFVFTTLMAPEGGAAGKLSRFTCETCHFEGTVDGRTHHTGRGDVHATTKTLRGLFGNRPHFTRALDRTTSAMIDNEFSVASRGTAFDPWFTLDPADHPWLATLGVKDPISPEEMRRAVFEFLVTFTPDPNPATLGRDRFTKLERRGAEVFAQHCETCHQARLRSDDPESRVVPASWEAYIFGNGAVLWASDERVKTGVEPYVHAEGARVVSLRRLWVKHPYFTNGSAPDLGAVLARCDLGPPFAHEPGASARPLTPEDQAALRAFLDLL